MQKIQGLFLFVNELIKFRARSPAQSNVFSFVMPVCYKGRTNFFVLFSPLSNGFHFFSRISEGCLRYFLIPADRTTWDKEKVLRLDGCRRLCNRGVCFDVQQSLFLCFMCNVLSHEFKAYKIQIRRKGEARG